MAGSALQNFIAAHRIKLDQEKQHLTQETRILDGDERGTTLPLHNRDDYREKLRKERQTEYQEYLKQKEGAKHHPQFENTSVQEKRRQLAEERERELSRQSSRSSNSRRYRDYNMHEGKDLYDELRDRKRKEQKRHREFLIDDNDDDESDYQRRSNMRRIDPMYRLEEDRFMEELHDNRGRRSRRPRMFDNDFLDRKVHFDDIEDYDDVTDRSASRRYKQTDLQDTHKRMKDHKSDHKDDEFASKSRRSNSAPLKGSMLIGREESVDSQKRKKQQYAEELRQQMQQKEKEKKLEKLERFGFKVDSENDHTSQQSAQDSSDKENRVPPQQERSLQTQNPPKLRRHSRDYPPENFYQSSRPPLPLDYYDYYRPHPQYYPPPMFPHYYQPDGYDYPYHPPMDQSRRNRVSYDDQYDEQPPQHNRRHPPVELRVTDHDQYKVNDQTKHTDRSPESKAAYRDILRKQIEEKHAKDERAKLERERYDEKLRQEIQEYDPWGKGGGGAPNQDYHGNIITDLRRMRKDNENNLLSGTPSTSPRTANFVSISDSNIKPDQRPATEGKSQPQPQPNQSSQEAYKEALQQQIAEKERAKQLEKEKQKIEEEKELLRLEKQRIKLQEEYERELAQQKAKEEDARHKNEAMKREAEEKRMAAIRKREEEELKEIKQRPPPQKPATPIPTIAPVEFRSDSPPVPALQNKVTGRSQDNQFSQQITIAPPSSPPIPTLRNKTSHPVTDNMNSASSRQSQHQHVENQSSHVNVSKAADERVDVLRQLSRMRLEFENEQKKIHRQLSGNSNTTTTSLSNVAVKPRRVARDVFQKKPSAPLPSTSNNTQDVSEQFNDLKYRKTSSRLSFMKKYPAPPKSESALDIQQDALLRHQERDLAKLRSDNVTSEHSLNSNKPLGSSMLLSPREQHSRKNLFGDKSLLEGSVTSLAQSRPELQKTDSKGERPPSHGGLSLSSIATLEVENIAARNEERMRRLDAILNSSKADNSDPEAVIRNFLENRDHSVLLPAQKRRASEVSLQADTRMCPVHSHE